MELIKGNAVSKTLETKENQNSAENPYALIPKYGNTLGASATEVPIRRFGPEVFQHFEEFFLNSWIDIYQYK
jgi:hypothetical protein